METQLTVGTELMRFFYSLPVGLLCGVLLEIFRTLRALLPHHPIAVFIEDTLFSFLCCFVLQCYAWSFCAGALRWQYAAGLLLGLAVWLCTFGAVWVRMLERLRRICRILCQKIRRVFVGLAEKSRKTEKNPQSP